MFFDEINAVDSETADFARHFDRNLARDPDEAAIAAKLGFDLFRRQAETFHSGEPPRGRLPVGDGLRIGIDRFGGNTFRENPSPRVENRPAYRKKSEGPLLLLQRPRLVVLMPDELHVTESRHDDYRPCREDREDLNDSLLRDRHRRSG
jgi:hypothetical protein